MEQIFKLTLEEQLMDESSSPEPTTITEAQSSNASPPSSHTEVLPTMYDSLVILDVDIDEQIHRFVRMVKETEELPVSSSRSIVGSLEEITNSMASHLKDIQSLVVAEESDLLLKNALMDKLSTTHEYMKNILRALEDHNGYTPHDFRGGVISTGKIPCYLD